MKEKTMKAIVETTGSFMLLNTTSEEIKSQRPTVTTMTPFVDVRINKKQLKVLARNLPKDANDKDFVEVLDEMDGDVKAAVEAYCAEFNVTIDGELTEAGELEATQNEKFNVLFENEDVAKEAVEFMADKEVGVEVFTTEDEIITADMVAKAKEANLVDTRVEEADEANKKLEEQKDEDSKSTDKTKSGKSSFLGFGK